MVASSDAMNAVFESSSRNREALTIVFTDIVGSTALKQRLGDVAGIALLERHDAVLRGLLREFSEARELELAGDSFLLSFREAADAVVFSLRLHTALVELSRDSGSKVCVRIGMHRGE